jgi:hypothetical protein
VAKFSSISDEIASGIAFTRRQYSQSIVNRRFRSTDNSEHHDDLQMADCGGGVGWSGEGTSNTFG